MKCIEVSKILNVTIALAKEKDHDQLLEDILTTAMDLTSCDAGTLYLVGRDYEKKQERLEFRVMITRSQGVFRGGKKGAIDLPPVEMNKRNVCACAAIEQRLINISDVYRDNQYDFSGPRTYDAMTGYKTTSMLVVPMENDMGQIIGVIQLINAQDEKGRTVSFAWQYNQVLLAIGCQAAISLTSMRYKKESIVLLDSFVRAMSTAIDERSPYNATHTRNMVKYGSRFIEWLNNRNGEWTFDSYESHQFLISMWLHDVGKLVIPLEVMDKNTRLGERLHDVKKRLKIVELLNKIEYLEKRISDEDYQGRKDQLEDVRALVLRVNEPGMVGKEDQEKVRKLAELTYTDTDGKIRPWFIEEELEALMVPKGTLTPKEREIMESHVIRTEKILGEMTFSRHYQKVPFWASSHHELLDGSGYPKGLKGDEIPREVRLLTILDIFEALTAKDRPYRPAMPLEKALEVLESMVKQGLLDGGILELFEQSQVWRDEWYENK